MEPCGLWWTGPKKITRNFKYQSGDQGSITVVFRQPSYAGLPVVRKELGQFINRVRSSLIEELKRAEAQDNHDTGFCLPLHEFMSMVRSKQV